MALLLPLSGWKLWNCWYQWPKCWLVTWCLLWCVTPSPKQGLLLDLMPAGSSGSPALQGRSSLPQGMSHTCIFRRKKIGFCLYGWEVSALSMTQSSWAPWKPSPSGFPCASSVQCLATRQRETITICLCAVGNGMAWGGFARGFTQRVGKSRTHIQPTALIHSCCIFPAAETFPVREKGPDWQHQGARPCFPPQNRYNPLVQEPPAKPSASLL